MRKATGILTGVCVLAAVHSASGWGPRVHQAATRQVLEHETIRPYVALFQLDPNAVVLASTEPMPAKTYQWGGWGHIKNGGKEQHGFLNNPNFTSLNLNLLVGSILHNCVDYGVPLGHAPANEVYDNKLLEAFFEGDCDQHRVIPPWSKVGVYSGPYSAKVAAFYHDEIALARWFKDHPKRGHWPEAGDRGITNGLRLGQTVMLNLFQQLDPGDANVDGKVDGRDLMVVLVHYGTTDWRGDLNGDGRVDAKDFAIWLAFLGRAPVGPATYAKGYTNIPEPGPIIYPEVIFGAAVFEEILRRF